MKKTVFYAMSASFAFAVGVYSFKIANTGHNELLFDDSQNNRRAYKAGLIEIDKEVIEDADLNFEMTLLTDGLKVYKEISQSKDAVQNTKEVLLPLREKVLDSLVERKLLYHYLLKDQNFTKRKEALEQDCKNEFLEFLGKRAADYGDPASKKRLKQRICETTFVRFYLEEEIYHKIAVGEPEALEYYNSHKESFRVPQSTYIRQVVFAEEIEAKRLAGVLNRSNFAQLAKTHSITPEADEGGLLGPIYKGSGLPPFYDVVYAMKEGHMSGILRSPYGFHIILVVKKDKERLLSFPEAKKDILATLRRREEEKAFKKWVQMALDVVPLNHATKLW